YSPIHWRVPMENEALFSAVKSGDLTTIQRQLQQDSSLLNALNLEGQTILLYAAECGQLAVVQFLLNESVHQTVPSRTDVPTQALKAVSSTPFWQSNLVPKRE